MRRKVGTAAAVVGLVGAFAFVGPGQADSSFKNKYDSSESVHDCGDDSTITYNGPLKMWPPNHKLQDVSITAHDGDAEPATDDTTLTVTFEVLDAVGGDGGPQHDPDVLMTNPVATGNPDAHRAVPAAERAVGQGRGAHLPPHRDGVVRQRPAHRLLHGGVRGLVPHDMRGGADWK